MNKIKVTKKNGLSFIWIKSMKGQQLNMNEVELLRNHDFNGLIPIQFKQKGSTFKLIYNISGYRTLEEYLKSAMNKQEFASLLENILNTLKNMQNIYFNYKNVLLSDFNKILVNPSSRSVFFIYVPIQYFDNEISLKEFFLKIVYQSIFSQEEDTGYVKEYIGILQRHLNFSTFELEEYIKRMKENSSQKAVKQSTEISNTPMETESNQNIYDPLARGEYTTVLANQDQDMNGTTRLGTEGEEELNFPYIIRDKNQEKILINKPSFRIGKESRYCDYFISDNSAISRSHADIITRENRYYIIDNNSTNKTYIDDRAIPILKEIEIFSGSRLRLANEEFIFYID